MDNDEKPVASESRIQMPGVLGFKETFAPSESKTLVLRIPPDYDFLLHRMTCRSDGALLFKSEVGPPPEPLAAPSRSRLSRSRRPWKRSTPATSRPSWASPWTSGLTRMRT